MNIYQKRYATMKAFADSARIAAQQEMESYNELLDTGTDEDLEKFVTLEMAADAKFSVAEWREKLHEAEEALLDWSYKTMMRLHPEHAETFALTLAPGSKGRKYLNHREGMIDTAFRLAA
jgi:hypothetical protein